jgi:hypothetical protein
VARKRKHRRAPGSARHMANVKAQRGLDREKHFSEGGTLVAWMGGPHTKTKNMRAWENKRRARGRVQ